MTKIDRQPVSSSNIKSIGYHGDSKTLAVEFAGGGGVYHYDGVSKEDYDELMAAKSIGSHFHKSIRGIYKHSKQD